MTIAPDDVRNPPCGDACPFARTCLICRFKGGAYGPADEQPVKKRCRKEARDG